MWWPYGIDSTQQWTLHLVSEALMRIDQVTHCAVDSAPFPTNGLLCFNLPEGRITEEPDADVLFTWRHLTQSTNHGEYGKFTIRVKKGGLWLSGQERLFAPREGYGEGVAFAFGPEAMRSYMRFHRAELFVKGRDGTLFARLYVQINTATTTLSLRARVNKSGSRFVADNNENYQIGVYGSLSDALSNCNVPWWMNRFMDRSQVIMDEERIRALVKSSPGLLGFFAGHYQTPPDLLREVVSQKDPNGHGVVQLLSKNLGAPPSVLRQVMTNAIGWIGRDAQATLETPEDVRRFLTSRD
jgi:hypothetical protein